MLPLLRRWVLKQFHRFYYDNSQHTWQDTRWMGQPVLKLPFDLWSYQEILYETRPDVVIETGTYRGGSALFFANVFDILGGGRVITVDVEHPRDASLPQHPRIEYVLGSSIAPTTVGAIRERLSAVDRVMVVLDADHSGSHVRAELEAYAALVTPGCYLVVEDTNVNGHPVLPSHGTGPMEALEDFLPGHPEFVSDTRRERFLMTFSPRGWLRRLETPHIPPIREES